MVGQSMIGKTLMRLVFLIAILVANCTPLFTPSAFSGDYSDPIVIKMDELGGGLQHRVDWEKRAQQATELFNKHKSTHYNNIDFLEEYCFVMRRADRPQLALKIYEMMPISKIQDDKLSFHYEDMASLNLLLGYYDKAIKNYLLAKKHIDLASTISSHKKSYPARINVLLSLAYFYKNQNDTALSLLDEAFNIDIISTKVVLHREKEFDQFRSMIPKKYYDLTVHDVETFREFNKFITKYPFVVVSMSANACRGNCDPEDPEVSKKHETYAFISKCLKKYYGNNVGHFYKRQLWMKINYAFVNYYAEDALYVHWGKFWGAYSLLTSSGTYFIVNTRTMETRTLKTYTWIDDNDEFDEKLFIEDVNKFIN